MRRRTLLPIWFRGKNRNLLGLLVGRINEGYFRYFTLDREGTGIRGSVPGAPVTGTRITLTAGLRLCVRACVRRRTSLHAWLSAVRRIRGLASVDRAIPLRHVPGVGPVADSFVIRPRNRGGAVLGRLSRLMRRFSITASSRMDDIRALRSCRRVVLAMGPGVFRLARTLVTLLVSRRRPWRGSLATLMRHRVPVDRLWLRTDGIRPDRPLGTGPLTVLPRNWRLVGGFLEKGGASTRWFRGPSPARSAPIDGPLMGRPRRSPPVHR